MNMKFFFLPFFFVQKSFLFFASLSLFLTSFDFDDRCSVALGTLIRIYGSSITYYTKKAEIWHNTSAWYIITCNREWQNKLYFPKTFFCNVVISWNSALRLNSEFSHFLPSLSVLLTCVYLSGEVETFPITAYEYLLILTTLGRIWCWVAISCSWNPPQYIC